MPHVILTGPGTACHAGPPRAHDSGPTSGRQADDTALRQVRAIEGDGSGIRLAGRCAHSGPGGRLMSNVPPNDAREHRLIDALAVRLDQDQRELPETSPPGAPPPGPSRTPS